MADYMATARTNYFRVTDEEKWQKLFNGLCCEGEIYDFTEERDGVRYHGFGAYSSIEYMSKEYVEDKTEEDSYDGYEYVFREEPSLLDRRTAQAYICLIPCII